MSFPTPDITEVNRPYWEGLAQGELRYQHCTKCGTDWLPARERCPGCLSDAHEWRPSAGAGSVVSWITYHMAYAPHLESRLPYDVTIVQLDEGPRLLTNITDSAAGEKLALGMRVTLAIEAEGTLHLPRFKIAGA